MIARYSSAPTALLILLLGSVQATAGEQQGGSRGTARPTEFEVASVKPSAQRPSGTALPSWGEGGARVDLQHVTLRYVLMHAFGANDSDVKGPDWLNSDFFDIQAVIPAAATKEDVPLMLINLLKVRFGLTYHEDTHMSPAYLLRVAEGGPKLAPPLPTDAYNTPAPSKSTAGNPDGRISGKGSGNFGPFKLMIVNNVMHYEFASMTMASLAGFLSQGQMDRPVADDTGLEGQYRVLVDVPVRRTPETSGTSDSIDDPAGASIETSLKRQGLKVESRTSPRRSIIIDHIDRIPTAN